MARFCEETNEYQGQIITQNLQGVLEIFKGQLTQKVLDKYY